MGLVGLLNRSRETDTGGLIGTGFAGLCVWISIVTWLKCGWSGEWPDWCLSEEVSKTVRAEEDVEENKEKEGEKERRNGARKVKVKGGEVMGGPLGEQRERNESKCLGNREGEGKGGGDVEG